MKASKGKGTRKQLSVLPENEYICTTVFHLLRQGLTNKKSFWLSCWTYHEKSHGKAGIFSFFAAFLMTQTVENFFKCKNKNSF